MTFNELTFHSHPDHLSAVEALAFFPNGYGANVAGGLPFHGDGINTFEVHVLRGDENHFDYVFNNPICELSIEYADKTEVEEALNDIETFVPYETDRTSH